MSIRDVVIGAIDPAMTLLPDRMDSAAAVCIMLAICGQEADFRHRWQVIDVRRPEVRGPARGCGSSSVAAACAGADTSGQP
ncbi:hypothetical protein ACFOEY_00035 [Paracandidimonas soli]|uniref:hypothetical protein n=1 Tax=Paracandidimonas soli TaxID=1917182 RepID=UPI0036222D94